MRGVCVRVCVCMRWGTGVVRIIFIEGWCGVVRIIFITGRRVCVCVRVRVCVCVRVRVREDVCVRVRREVCVLGRSHAEGEVANLRL